MDTVEEIYSPAEDSWLLEECILSEDLRGKKCLDVGCGSGIQSVALLKAGAKQVVAVDVNPLALKQTEKLIKDFLSTQNAGQIFSIKESDLFENISEGFDCIVFNPPYVPSDGVKWRDLDGGKEGAQVIMRFCEQAPQHLNKKGFILLLISSLNNLNKVQGVLAAQGLAVEVVARKKLFFEELLVLRASAD